MRFSDITSSIVRLLGSEDPSPARSSASVSATPLTPSTSVDGSLASPSVVGFATGKTPADSGMSRWDVLTIADFTAQGLWPTLSAPSINLDADGMGAYCSYTEASVIEGGIEFDVFYPADHEVYQTMIAEAGAESTQVVELASDESVTFTLNDGKAAAINVRRGALVFGIAIPNGPRAADQLRGLAYAVLERTGG
jgi:hypothetical protein